MPLETPILFCVFHRPDLAQQVFSAIREQRPRTLLVVQDGPRPDRPGEAARVEQTRRLLDQVDWDCDLRMDFAPANMGCQARMNSGITWAFSQFERLIILEDDCLPAPSFFGYCEALLARFAEDERIMLISGDNFQPAPRTPHSYYFSKWTHIWGWASWRRAWEWNDPSMQAWPEFRQSDGLRRWCCDEPEAAHWTEVFDRAHAGGIDTWDFAWMFACWRRGGLTVLPRCNLVSNLGFGQDATHTLDSTSRLSRLPTGELGPLRHPPEVDRDAAADAYTWRHVFQDSSDRAARPERTRWWPRWLPRRRKTA
jgi:hypothetical protein